MTSAIRPTRVNHINMVVEDFDVSVAHFRDVLGGDFLLDLPQREWHAYLIEVGRVILEAFVPPTFLLNARYGPHYLGVEYQADMEEVREAIAAHGIRIVRDIGVALHTHPADGLGVAFEFYAGSFHDNDWPLLGGKMRSTAFWRDEHPLGLTGLRGYTIAVDDMAAASAFMKSFLSAEPVYEADRPEIAARVVGLQVADSIVELQTPVEDGALQQHLRRFGPGIRSTIFETRDLDQARRYFAERGAELESGAAPDRFALPPGANLGLLFEFSEGT